MESIENRVLLTGITGFLGSHVGKLLVEQCSDTFKIRVSTRNASKAAILKKTFPQDHIEWVEADLQDEQQLSRAIEGCTHIIHVASPIPNANDKVTNEQMVEVASKGITYILNACKQHKVKKLIVTSSLAAISGNAFKGNENPNYDENDYAMANDKNLDGYAYSKCLQEDICIKFVEENKNVEGATEVCTLHPSFILGPPLNELASSSVEGMKKLVDGSIPVVPQIHLPSIDVRDCAQAHIAALLAAPGALNGQRILISQESFWMIDFQRIIHDHFKDKGLPNVATREVGYKFMSLVSPFDSQVKIILPIIGIKQYANN